MRPTPALLVLALVACSRPASVVRTAPPAASTEPPPDSLPPAPVPPTEPASAADADCDRKSTPEEVAETATAPLADVVVQLDTQPTNLVIIRPSVGTPFSRVPEFTLYRDGTTFRATEGGVVTGKLTAAEVSAFVARLGQLGVDRLLTHRGRCSCRKPGEDGGTCLDDGDTTILRVTVDGKLHHSIVYGDYWNDASAAHAILEEIRHQKPRGEKPYVPKTATLVFFARPDDAAPPPDCASLPSAVAHVFQRPEHGYYLWARAVEGKDLVGLSKVLGSAQRTVCVGKQAYVATLYPWLPGMDHRAAIASWEERAATIGSE